MKISDSKRLYAHSPLVSVVVTTRNSAQFINNCFTSILDQTYTNIELLVVDNNSSDDTKKIAFLYTKQVYNFGPERSAQRNFGARKSNGFYFLYLDSDMTLSRTVISESVEKLEKNPDLLALYIPEIVTGVNYWSQVRRFERSFYDATVIDCVRFIRTNVFKKIGGFDETMSGPEDWDLDKKIRKTGSVGSVKSPLYHNEEEFKIQNYLAKKRYYTVSFKKYIEKWGPNDTDIHKQLGLRYRFFEVFTENGKWRKIVSHPFLSIGMFVLKFILGFQYLIMKYKH